MSCTAKKLALSVIVMFLTATLVAQQPPAGQTGDPQGRGGGRGGRGGGGGRGPALPDDNTGFESIFDGKTLANWDGDTAFWKVDNGAIVGQSTPENPVKQNTFLIWRGGTTKDFELKVEVRMDSTNSGIQYRSKQLPESSAQPPVGKWVMQGYQADIDFANNYTGMLYEERGPRGFLAPRGIFSRIAEDGRNKKIGSVGDGEALKAFIKPGDWNQYHIIARGTVFIHVLNGHVMSVLLDDDPKGRNMEGLLGLQMHTGPPMKIEFRNVLLKKL